MAGLFKKIKNQITRLLGRLSNVFIFIVRQIEFLFTGQADYMIYPDKISENDRIEDHIKAKKLQSEVEEYLTEKFNLKLEQPVFLEFYSGEQLSIKGLLMELSGTQGGYHFEKFGASGQFHTIFMRKGLPRNKFKSILAHEVAHAFLREKTLVPTDRYLREGFARWIEYKILLDMGETEEAEKLKNIKNWKHGKAIEKVLKLEAKVGVKGVMDVFRRID